MENEDETRRKLREAGAEYRFTVDREDFFEEKYKGPDAVMIDITAPGGLERTVIGSASSCRAAFADISIAKPERYTQ